MATHSGILAWRIPWTEEPGGRKALDKTEWHTHTHTEFVHCGENYAPPKFICWSPNPQYFKMWLFLEMESLKGQLSWISVIEISLQFSSVQSLSRVWLSATPWPAAHQASLSITNSRSLLTHAIASVMPSNHLILCRPLSAPPSWSNITGFLIRRD